MVTKEYYDGLKRKWKVEYRKYGGHINITRVRKKAVDQHHCTFFINLAMDTVTIREQYQLEYFMPLLVDYIINEIKINNILVRK